MTNGRENKRNVSVVKIVWKKRKRLAKNGFEQRDKLFLNFMAFKGISERRCMASGGTMKNGFSNHSIFFWS